MKSTDDKCKKSADGKRRMKLRDPAVRKPPTTLSPTPPPKFKRLKKLRYICERSPPPKVRRKSRRSPSPLPSRSPSPSPARSQSSSLERSRSPSPVLCPQPQPRVVKKSLITKGNQSRKVLGFSSYAQSPNPLQHISTIQPPLVPPQVFPIEHALPQNHSQQRSNLIPSARTPQQSMLSRSAASQCNNGSRGLSNCSANPTAGYATNLVNGLNDKERKMNERVKEIAIEEGLEETNEPGNILPLEKQLQIINEVVPQKRGTIISGVGDSLRRPPLPKGGATTSASLLQQIEETKKAREENASLKSQVSILEDRMRRLEDLMMRGSPEVGSSNALDIPIR